MKETIYNKETSNCLVLISHKMDENSFKYFSFLQKEADGIMDLSFYMIVQHVKLKRGIIRNLLSIFFDSKEIIDFFHGGNKQLPNPLLALLDLIKVKKNQWKLSGDKHLYTPAHTPACEYYSGQMFLFKMSLKRYFV